MGEIQYFLGEEQPDKDYIQEVAHIKRLLEYCTMVPGFQQHFTENPQAALAWKCGMSHLPMRLICFVAGSFHLPITLCGRRNR